MMLVDCTTCPVRDVHCGDCMVTALDAIDGLDAAVVGGTVDTADGAGGAGATGTVPISATRLSLTPRSPARSVLSAVGSGPPVHGAAQPDASVLPLDRAERRAVSVLLGAGLVSVGEANAARAVPTALDLATTLAAHSRGGGATGGHSRGRATG